MVCERGLEVLRVIVQDYVESSEPVGSKSIVDRYGFGVSAATIRNDMAPSRRTASSRPRTPRPAACRPTRATVSSSTTSRTSVR